MKNVHRARSFFILKRAENRFFRDFQRFTQKALTVRNEVDILNELSERADKSKEELHKSY